MEAVVLHRVGFLAYFCPKQGQGFKPSAAPIYPNMGKVPHREVEVLEDDAIFDLRPEGPSRRAVSVVA